MKYYSLARVLFSVVEPLEYLPAAFLNSLYWYYQ